MNAWTDIRAIFTNRELALTFCIAFTVLALLISKLGKSLVLITKILASKMFTGYFLELMKPGVFTAMLN